MNKECYSPVHKTWSVFDMLKFYPSSLVTGILWYDVALHELATGDKTPSEFLENAKENLELIREATKKSGMEDVSERADSIISNWIDHENGSENEIVKIGAVKALVSELFGTIQKRLMKDLFFRIEPRQRPFYDGLALAQKTEVAFPSSAKDCIEAGRCFALDRWTACVMHLMRALEYPIQVLAKALNLQPSNRNWENILNEIEKEIRKISPTTHGQSWKDEAHFYSEAALNFRFIKNAWRNYAVHGHETYNSYEAHEIMLHVRSFMDHLATKISE